MDSQLGLRLAHALFFIHFTTAYELPANYFINCGSNSSTVLHAQNYSPDLNTFFTPLNSTTALEAFSTSSVPILYQTARVYAPQPGSSSGNSLSYKFRISQKCTHLILRLHFHPFSNAHFNLSDTKFHVSIAKSTLLYNFNVVAGSVVVKEFLVPVTITNISSLSVDFTPVKGSRFVFVNVIEAFCTPDNLVQDSGFRVTKRGIADTFQRKVLHKIYRLNMGGGVLTPENDTLNRYWDADDPHLHIPNAAKNSEINTAKPTWNYSLSDEFIAPDLVYQTAKELNVDHSRLANSFNATWGFEVARNAKHIVRAHFCNFMSDSMDDILFNFFIDGYFGIQISPSKIAHGLNVPFYLDFIAESDQSGSMNISIGSVSESRMKTAFLNGLEIMEIMDDDSMFRDRGQVNTSKTRLIIIAGSVVGGVVLLVILFLGVLFMLHRLKVKSTKSSPKMNDESGKPVMKFKLGWKIPIDEIICATKNFDESLMIGKGGFGKVFRGKFQDGTKVAVKRSEPGHGQGLPEFQTEIIVLSKIRHVHLVSLIGYCDEMSEMILVYEFMENGTVREHLYGGSSETPRLSWETRLEICIGAARGLHYLHAGAIGGIIHRDVKSTNILLDENYKAKVADFGLSSVLLDHSHVTTGIKGSFGYLDPEYLMTMQLTEKSDVYSFGVVLLEVVCARKVIKNSNRREEINLAEWGMLWHKNGQFGEIIDPFLSNKIDSNSLRVFVETAEKCLRADGVDRPTMSEVIWWLEYSLQLQNTEAMREAGYEYSTVTTTSGTYLDLEVKMVQHLPSLNMKMDEEEDASSSMLFDDSETSASDIFSQLKIEESR